MVETAFNLFDLVVLAVVGLSALLSFFRGFIREILSLGAWVGASLITLYCFLDVAALIQPQVQNSVVASGLAAMGTFIGSLLLISIGNAILMRLFKRGEDVGVLDNALGLVFGVLRALLLLSMGYFAFSVVVPEDQYPDWLLEAKSRPIVEAGAKVVADMAPGYLEALGAGSGNEDASLNDGETVEGLIEQIETREQDGTPGDGKGQEWMNMDELERMIQQTQDKMKESAE